MKYGNMDSRFRGNDSESSTCGFSRRLKIKNKLDYLAPAVERVFIER
ncbi:MAG: hypothetical protein V1779_12655 [bacterium]